MTQASNEGGGIERPGEPVRALDLVANPDLDKANASGIDEIVKKAKDTSGSAASSSGTGASQGEIGLEDYNPDKSRDATRQTITLWLIGLLCAIVSLSFVVLFARGASTGFSSANFFGEFKQVLDVLVPPVTTLLASAVGFYFGFKQAESQNGSKHDKR